MKKLLLTGAALIGLASSHLRATEYIFGDFDTTLLKSTGVAWNSGLLNVELGTFINGFTPTTANRSDWVANWVSDSPGYYDPSGPEWSSSLVLANNNVFAQNAQLYLWAFDSQTGNAAESALLDDASWKVGLNDPLALNPNFFAFSVATKAVVGSFDFADMTAMTAVASTSSPGAVPEPSTYGLFGALALFGLVAYRRNRRSN